MRKILTLTLALCMLFSLFTGTISAGAAEINQGQMQMLLKSLSIMQGDENGDFHTEDFVTRAEFAKVAVASSQWRNSVSKVSRVSPFPDVPYTHWGASYVRVASANGLIKGYPDSTFKPEECVLLEEGVTVALKLLGYTDADFGLSWPEGQMSLATRLELLDGIDKGVGDKMQRKDVMMLVFNTLDTEIKNQSVKAINAFGYTILNDTVLIATTNEDSSVAKNHIVTSSGTYKISEYFDYSLVGLKGNLVVKNNDNAVAFLPENNLAGSYSIYTVLNDDILVYSGGKTQALGVASDTAAYRGQEKGTVNSFLSRIKQGDSISLYRNHLGDIEYVIIGTESLKGPFTVKNLSTLENDYDISDNAVFMKDSKVVSKSQISINDIIYVSDEMDLVWAYSKKVTGVYESALPNKDNVTSIILSGTTYEIESSLAFNKLVTGGAASLGDTVTLLLGKEGKIADVLTSEKESSVTYGYLTGTGTKEYTDSNSNAYTSYFAKIVTADGVELDFKTAKDYKEIKSSVVSVTISSDGTRISRTQKPSLYGVFDYNNMTFGGMKVATDVKIMDVMNTNVSKNPLYITVYPQRLDQVSVSSGKVLWYTQNQKGEIDTLYLDNITNDGYSYGIVTDAQGMYTCNIAGEIKTVSGGNTTYAVTSGSAARFTISQNSVTSISALTKLNSRVESFTKSEVKTKDSVHYISDKVVCYKRTGVGEWQLVSLDDLAGKTTSVEFYFDKSARMGGKIRVIIAY